MRSERIHGLPALHVRADGSRSLGLGHLSRCSALVEEAQQRGWDAGYVTAPDELAVAFLRRRTLPMVRAGDEWFDSIRPGDIVVLDGYHLGAGDLARARDAGAVTVVIDDTGRVDLAADVLVDPNAEDASRYAGADVGTLLLGPDHALVRRGFLEHRRRRDAPSPAVVVTMGGSDVAGLGASAASALAHRHVAALLVEGPGAPLSGFQPVVRDPEDIAAVFDVAGVAVAASGSTVWELCAMGIPTVLVVVADNQRAIARTAVAAGAATEAAPDADAVAAAVEAVLAGDLGTRSDAALALVDGQGPKRILDAAEAVSRAGPS